MQALSLAVLLAAAPPAVAGDAVPGTAPPIAAPVPISAAPASAPPPVSRPALVSPEAPAAPPAPAAASPAQAAPPPALPAAKPIPLLPQAAVEKLGQGDRAFLERDYRNALFAYQDAVYLAPENPVARVKLGRAYLALRYPAQAIAQAERALAADPANAEARKLIEDAQNPARAAPAAAPQPASAVAAPGSVPPAARPAAPASGPRVFRFVPEPDAPAAPAASAPAAFAGGAASSGPGTAAVAPQGGPSPAVREAARDEQATRGSGVGPEAAPAGTPAAARARQRYRDAVEHVRDREFEKAIAALDDAIALDPKLAVAYAARASARFGAGRHREAAEDYRASLALDGSLATPLYGLAECHRVLGESGQAAEMYRRYAESRASDVREDLRGIAAKRAVELR